MAKKSKLLAALDAHRGRDYKLEHQKKLAKKARKRKAQNASVNKPEDAGDNGPSNGSESDAAEQSDEDMEGEDLDEAPAAIDIAEIDDTDSESDNGEEEGGVPVEDDEWVSEDEADSDIALSDIESLDDEDKNDLVPHQRLTINNTSALLQALKSIALPTSKMPFSEHQTVISSEPVGIPDINDDLNRELAFYKQSLDAAVEARSLLKKEGVPFTRPADYFAEMVKSDEHMGVIKKKMMDEAASKKAAAEARKQRDLKKFGKQVQVAKLQERDKAKRETMEKIQILKRKRQGTDTGEAHEEDLFDVALEDASKADKRDRSSKTGSAGNGNFKRQKRDQKFGFGGKKRFSKSGDATSSGDIKGFSAKKMKGQKKTIPRLGKNRRRAKQG